MLGLRRLSSGLSRGPLSGLPSSYPRRIYTQTAIQEGDLVLLRPKANSNAAILTKPLQSGHSTNIEQDRVQHDDILGKELRAIVTSRKRVDYRIYRPTLNEYTDLSSRIVTPIYSQDANLIVSLLDIHPTSGKESGEKFEIFEAGTGHGALTLNLSRAIHGMNEPQPQISHDDMLMPAWQDWKRERRAIIHTLDISTRHSEHAKVVIENFRQGMYSPHIDFHVGNINAYISKRLEENSNTPFFEHAILDLPGTDNYLDIIGKAIKPNGTLITFCPSITQISASLMHAKTNKLPLFLERVLEIGSGVGVGGREWDVRPVKPRALLKAESELMGSEGGSVSDAAGESAAPNIEAISKSGWEMVCRPKVGLRVVGGGFIGVWKKFMD